MHHYKRQTERQSDWPPFLPPSPAIVSWESAACFPATVFCEGLQSIDCGRKTCLPFQLIGAKWINGKELAGSLSAQKLPGVEFTPHRYNTRPCTGTPNIVDGIWMRITDPDRFKPIVTTVSLICSLQELYGTNQVWNKRNTRSEWFDKLFGTDSVRKALLDGENSKTISARWQKDLAIFNKQRQKHILYHGKPFQMKV